MEDNCNKDDKMSSTLSISGNEIHHNMINNHIYIKYIKNISIFGKKILSQETNNAIENIQNNRQKEINSSKRFTGHVIKYDYKVSKLGTIYTKKYKEVVFSINDVKNNVAKDKMKIFRGPKVTFNIEQDGQKLCAKNIIVKPFKNYLPLICIVFLLALMIFFNFYLKMHEIISYLLSINIITFCLYGYEQYIASWNRKNKVKKIHISKFALHCYEYLGGSLIAPIATLIWSYKTIDEQFQIDYYLTVIVQLLIIITTLLCSIISPILGKTIFLVLFIGIFCFICLDHKRSSY